MRNHIWLLAPCAVFLIAACDASETVDPSIGVPERTVVIETAPQTTAPAQIDLAADIGPTPGTPEFEAAQAETVERTARTKARIEDIKERLGRPQRSRLRDRDADADSGAGAN